MRTYFFLAFVLLATCAVRAADSDPAATPPAETGNYVLHAGDLIHVQVFQEPDLEREVRVAKDLSVVLPLIGRVSVAKVTLREVETEIARRYNADYLVNPQINVTVVRYTERRINVMGSVNSPGAVVIPPEEQLTLLDAITRAGGFNRYADHRRVRLTRTNEAGETQQFEIDADKIMEGTSQNAWVLQQGDNVYVPERRI